MADPSSTSSSEAGQPRFLRTRWLVLWSLVVLAALEMAIPSVVSLWSDLPGRLEAFEQRQQTRAPVIAVVGTCLAESLQPRILEPFLGGGAKVYNFAQGDAGPLNWYLVAANHVLKGRGVQAILVACNPADLLTAVRGVEGEANAMDLAAWRDMPLIMEVTRGPRQGRLNLLLSKAWRTYRYRLFLARAVWLSLDVQDPGTSWGAGEPGPVGPGGSLSPTEIPGPGGAQEDPLQAQYDRELKAFLCLERLLDVAREHGTPVLFVPLPERDPKPAVWDAVARLTIAPLGLEVLDARAEARMHAGDFVDDRHMTRLGAQKYCRALAPALSRRFSLQSARGAGPAPRP